MLSFLRRIRHSLVTSGNTGRYLAYAVGEVALVVIGILIALQINNWTEDKKERKWEQYYLDRLTRDLNGDLDEFEVTLERNYNRILIGNHLLNQLGESDYMKYFWPQWVGQAMFEKFPSQDSLTKILPLQNQWRMLARKPRTFTARSTSYEEMLSSGRFETIRSDSLREALSEYYWRIDDVSQQQAVLLKSNESYLAVLSEQKLPIVLKDDMTDLKSLLKDQESYKAAMIKLMSNLWFTELLYYWSVKPNAEKLVDRIEQYQKEAF